MWLEMRAAGGDVGVPESEDLLLSEMSLCLCLCCRLALSLWLLQMLCLCCCPSLPPLLPLPLPHLLI